MNRQNSSLDVMKFLVRLYILQKKEIYKCIYFLLKSLTKYEGWSFTETKSILRNSRKLKTKLFSHPRPLHFSIEFPRITPFIVVGNTHRKCLLVSFRVPLCKNKKKTNINLLPTCSTWPVYFCKVHLTENLFKSPCISKTIFLFFTYLF